MFRVFPKLVQKSLLNRAIPGARSLLAAAVDCVRSASAAPFARALADAMIGLALQWLVAFFRVCDGDAAAEAGRITPLTFAGNDTRP
ncbi:siderophore biosynthesis protein, IucA/IucC family [Burkholderiales bacterium GJ-E10]|nr:siderophore biosynthesis protein, IucA/IucC family [Burkholderiales bacterium GJ-E10]